MRKPGSLIGWRDRTLISPPRLRLRQIVAAIGVDEVIDPEEQLLTDDLATAEAMRSSKLSFTNAIGSRRPKIQPRDRGLSARPVVGRFPEANAGTSTILI